MSVHEVRAVDVPSEMVGMVLVFAVGYEGCDDLRYAFSLFDGGVVSRECCNILVGNAKEKRQMKGFP